MAIQIIPILLARAGAGIARGTVVAGAGAARVARAGALRLSARMGGLITKYSLSAKKFFRGKSNKATVRVRFKKAMMKLDRIDDIVQNVIKDAVPVMQKNTSKVSGYARGHVRQRGPYRIKAEYKYASYLDRPGVQLSSSDGNPAGFTKPTEDYIKKEIKRRIKKELGR